METSQGGVEDKQACEFAQCHGLAHHTPIMSKRTADQERAYNRDKDCMRQNVKARWKSSLSLREQ